MDLEHLSRALFWTIPFAATVILSAFLLHLYHKDKDKRKLTFMFSFAFASIGYCNVMLQKYGVATLWQTNYTWSFIPVGAAGLIAVISSLENRENFERPFKFFILALCASILLLSFPNTMEAFRIPLLCTFAASFLPISIFLFAKKGGNSNLMFLLAYSCFIFSWISIDFGLQEEITVLLTLFAFVFTALMFTTTSDRIVGDMASFFMLKDKLEKTEETLKLTQQRAKKELEASEERYRTLCDEGRFVMLRMDRKGTVKYANNAIEKSGLKKADVIGKNMLKFIPMRKRLKLFSVHVKVIRGNNVEGETEIVTPKGILIVEYASNPVREGGKIIGCETLFRDVTEKKEMERKLQEYATQLEAKVEERTLALRKSEKKLACAVDQQSSLMRSSAAMINTVKLHERLQAIIDAIHSLGWRRVVLSVRNEQLDIEKDSDIVTIGLTQEERRLLWTDRQSGKVWQERFGPKFERFKMGEFYYLPWDDPFVRAKFGKSIVSSHLKREDSLDWNPDDLLYALLKLADGRLVAVLSVDDPEDGQKPTKESLAPLELFLHQAAVAIENARLIEQLNKVNAEVKKYADQLEIKVEERTRKLVDAQNKLLQSERLAAIGQIAGMVGHDLRNPLASIAGAVYYLKMRGQSQMSGKEKEMYAAIEKSIDRSNKIIGDLLDYSREIRLDLSETDPLSLVEEALTQIEVPKGISIAKEVYSEPRTKADREKILRVFINLIKNAIDAMPSGGVLTITSEKTGNSVYIKFMDTGTGISEENFQKLWTPLFTTKGKGMGFGLPICKRFIEAHGGKILVESQVGKGTTFTVVLPISNGDDQNQDFIVNLPRAEVDAKASR